MRLVCTNCNSVDVKLFKVMFKNKTWHCRGVCNGCGKLRDLPKKLFYKDSLPEIKIEINNEEHHRRLCFENK